ncbi:MAG: hypothetical protein CMF59_15675 [Leptospiraceae bacterium]|nr:hypothetical protein [Leptospiraceae bacterium]
MVGAAISSSAQGIMNSAWELGRRNAGMSNSYTASVTPSLQSLASFIGGIASAGVGAHYAQQQQAEKQREIEEAWEIAKKAQEQGKKNEILGIFLGATRDEKLARVLADRFNQAMGQASVSKAIEIRNKSLNRTSREGQLSSAADVAAATLPADKRAGMQRQLYIEIDELSQASGMSIEEATELVIRSYGGDSTNALSPGTMRTLKIMDQDWSDSHSLGGDQPGYLQSQVYNAMMSMVFGDSPNSAPPSAPNQVWFPMGESSMGPQTLDVQQRGPVAYFDFYKEKGHKADFAELYRQKHTGGTDWQDPISENLYRTHYMMWDPAKNDLLERELRIRGLDPVRYQLLKDSGFASVPERDLRMLDLKISIAESEGYDTEIAAAWDGRMDPGAPGMLEEYRRYAQWLDTPERRSAMWHNLLSTAGTIPLFGLPFDLADASLHAYEAATGTGIGSWDGMALSALAAPPAFGYMSNGVRTGRNIYRGSKILTGLAKIKSYAQATKRLAPIQRVKQFSRAIGTKVPNFFKNNPKVGVGAYEAVLEGSRAVFVEQMVRDDLPFFSTETLVTFSGSALISSISGRNPYVSGSSSFLFSYGTQSINASMNSNYEVNSLQALSTGLLSSYGTFGSKDINNWLRSDKWGKFSKTQADYSAPLLKEQYLFPAHFFHEYLWNSLGGQ